MMQFPSSRKIVHTVVVCCGVFLLGQQSVFGADIDDFEIDGSIEQEAYGISSSFGKWIINTVPYVYNSTGAPADWPVAAMESVFADAIAEWEGYCNITFDYQGVDDTAVWDDTTDDVVAFAWGDLAGAAGRAGPAWTTASETAWGHWLYLEGTMRLDPTVFASAGTTEAEMIRFGEAIRATAAHELGHLIGLGHSDRPDSLMYSNPYNSINHTMQDDIDACREMYGYSTVYNPPPVYTPPAAGTTNYDILFLAAFSDANTQITTDDGTLAGTDTLAVRWQNTSGPYPITQVHVVVDPLGRTSTAAQTDIVGPSAGAYGIARFSTLREIPGLWTVYVYDGTGLATTLTINVTTSLPVVNEPPTVEITFSENPSNRSISVTANVTGDTEGDNATINWHIPSVGIVSVPLGGSSGSDTQNVQLLDQFDWDLYVDVRDDAARYTGVDPGTGPAGDGFHNLWHYFASSLLQGPDFNGDNSSDILWRNTSTGQNWFWGVNGNFVSTSMGINNVASPNWGIAGTGDFNADGKSDILWRNSASGQLWTYMMNGNTIETSAGINMTIRTVPGAESVIAGTGDYDGDGSSDILWRNNNTGFNWIYFMNGATIADALGINIVSTPGWNIVGSGDFDGDRDDDILWRNANTGQNWIYLTNGATITTSAGINTIASQDWQVAGIADFNGDTYDDILWRNSVTGQNWIFFMQNATILASLGLNTVPAGWDVVGVGDYNADSYGDVLWRNSTSGQNWIHFLIGNTVVGSAGTSNVPDTDWQAIHRN